MSKLLKFLKDRILTLDGATGTELQKYGMPQGICPELWCLENPKVLSQIHKEYVSCGSDIVCTATFGANRIKLGSYKASSVRQVNRNLALIARKSIGRRALVAGDIGPTGQFVEPFGALSFDEAVGVFKEQIQGLIEGGVDLLIIETMMDIQEARAALLAAKEITKKEVFVTLTFEKNNRTLNGTDPMSALITLESLGAAAIGCNCSIGPRQMIPLIRQMSKAANIPLIAKPNAGFPVLKNEKTVFRMTPKSFGMYGRRLIKAGASILGGCCGTTPRHILELKKQVKFSKPNRRAQNKISKVSSAQGYLIFDGKKRPILIGECINPTGRSMLSKELKSGKTALVRRMALEQKRQGAQLLDVNVGIANANESSLLAKIVKCLSVASPLPLVIDTSSPAALDAALRIYPGRALINSISGEPGKSSQMLSIAKKYGAMFILLPIEKNIPETFQKRRLAIKKILQRALKKGFSKQDILVDGIATTVASTKNAAVETLKTIEFCSRSLNLKTVCGLSNVSFGMPQRFLLNNTFFSLLKESGLSCVIANPAYLCLKKSKLAIDVLLNRPYSRERYISHFQKHLRSGMIKKQNQEIDLKQGVYESIVEGDSQALRLYLRKLVKAESPQGIVESIVVPAMNKVGILFEKKEYFLPQLIASAETAKEAFQILKPLLQKSHIKSDSRAVIILATVKGDIHDIGKNIVSLMLKNHGFDVVDLGKDVSAEKIVQEAKRHKNPIIGLSALMTTTMVSMKEVISLAKKQNIDCRFMVGGAVLTREYADSLGALYSKDGVEAVRVAKHLAHDMYNK